MTGSMSLSFQTHPDHYKHWKLSVDGDIAYLTMKVDPHGGLHGDYELKLNSYDLGVDIELADAVQRLRFEHTEVKVVVIDSGLDRVFCAGANIPMLGGSAHAFKVNFCKFTNETRLYIEDASKNSGIKFLAALNGTCAGGGYELALACDEIVLVDDGNSAVSLPEVPLLGVLPGTGGLTRVVDKRRVRRDRADIFCTTSEGVRGKRAVDWNLVDAIYPRSKFDEGIQERVDSLKATVKKERGPSIELPPIKPEQSESSYKYEFVTVDLDNAQRIATLTVSAPNFEQPKTREQIQRAGAGQWALKAFRELDDALLRLRFSHMDIGVLVLQTRGSLDAVAAVDEALFEHREHWLASEIIIFQARVLRRLDMMSRSMFSLIDEGSCFCGSLLELALASDRVYMLEHDDDAVKVQLTSLNRGAYPTATGLTRLETRFFESPDKLETVLNQSGPIVTGDADKLGLVTIAADDIDWDDDVRIAIEERASMSPDALTGMEASLRFPGPETIESKIFARLSAWQNWIFQRPNAVGPEGALTKYGQPERPSFNWTRC